MEENKANYFSRITKALLIIFPLLLLLAMLQMTVTVSAYEYASGPCGDNLTWVLDSDGTLTISGEGEMFFSNTTEAPWYDYREMITSVIIELGVTSIYDRAFYNCENLRSTSISDSVTEIGDFAFYSCSSLTSVTIPDGVMSIGISAFELCSSLVDISLPNSMTNLGEAVFYDCPSLNNIIIPDGITRIEDDTFGNCSSLTSIIIPDDVTSIGVGVFYNCSNLESVIISDNVTSIGAGAFYNCKSLKSITIPDGVTKIENSVFTYCLSLNSITIPDGVTSIGNSAFRGCINLVHITIPDGVTTINLAAFLGCISLDNIMIPESVTTIGNGAFCCCTSLTSITVPDGVITIGDDAFSWCYNLKSIYIPSSVNSIGLNVFYRNFNLTDIYYGGTEDNWDAIWQDMPLEGINLFSINDYNTKLSIVITYEEVPGGMVVTMESAKGSIYYALDGTDPCSSSIPYEGPFFLDEPGSYSISARTFDLEAGEYGEIASLDAFTIAKSDIPEIEAIGDHVYIQPSDDVYYTLDLSEDPDTTYTVPLDWDGNTFVKAQRIESGKAASDTVSCYFQKTVSGFVYGRDNYSFTNEAPSFGYQDDENNENYSIPESQMIKLFGPAAGTLLLEDMAEENVSIGAWRGSCFGMCATALMFSRGNLSLGNYMENPSSVYDLSAPGVKNSPLTRLIERYQLSQYARAVENEKNENLSNNDKSSVGRILTKLTEIFQGDDTDVMILILYGGSDSVHAVVPYRLEQDNNGNSRVYIYDPDFPDQAEGENVIRFDQKILDNGNIGYHFMYQDPTGARYEKAISYNRLETVLKTVDSVRSYNPEGILQGIESEGYMLLSLNTEDYRILEEDGNEMSDYILLNTMISILPGKTVLYLPEGKYTIKNLSEEMGPLSVGVATSDEYYRAEIQDPSAEVGIGIEYGHLSLWVNAGEPTQIAVHTLNTGSRENDIQTIAVYAKIYACTEQAILIETTAAVIIANEEEQNLESSVLDDNLYSGAIAQKIAESAGKSYQIKECSLTTDIDGLSGKPFTLIVRVNGTDKGMLYEASYNEAGRMIEVRNRQIEPGKIKYPFTIGEEVTKVQVFLVDQETGVPLTGSLTIQ